MPADLERATHLEGADGRYRARLSRDWEIWGPNGGYLATFALRAAGELAQIPKPRSFYCHFLSSPRFDAVQLDVRVLKRGRRAESLAVEMTQGDKPILHALVKTAADGPGFSHRHMQAPSVPAPEELETYRRRGSPDEPLFKFWENVELRPTEPQGAPRSSDPTVRQWTRFRPTARFEDPFVDAARALILLDTYGFPAAYRRHRSHEYLAPNLDTSAWFHHSSPDCEWLLIDHECFLAEDGLMAVNGRVWDTEGALVASGAAQLCCIPNPGARG